MSASRISKRTVRYPPADFPHRDIPVSRIHQKRFVRVHNAKKNAVHFGLRSYSNRFSHPNLPFGVLYAAESFDTCCWERFGDELMNKDLSLKNWNLMVCSQIKLSAKLCDLTNLKTLFSCGTDQASITQANISVAQQWAFAIAQHPEDFDGIIYPSRFGAGACLALFGKSAFINLEANRIFAFDDNPDSCQEFIKQYNIRLI